MIDTLQKVVGGFVRGELLTWTASMEITDAPNTSSEGSLSTPHLDAATMLADERRAKEEKREMTPGNIFCAQSQDNLDEQLNGSNVCSDGLLGVL